MADSEIIGRTKINCMDIEIAVAEYFGVRANLIVPNVSWGLWVHECDLLVVTKAGYCYEVEIKTSRSDLKADMRKHHGHNSKRIRRLYFAIPTELMDNIEFIPARAGILEVSVRTKGAYPSCKCVREPEILPAQKLSDKERFQIARLGTMRIFPLKKIVRQKSREVGRYISNAGNLKLPTATREEFNMGRIGKDTKGVSLVERMSEALQWCGGSADFAPGGKARKGWLKICTPLIKEAAATKHQQRKGDI